MKNKKSIIKTVGLLSLCMGSLSLSFTSATTSFKINLPEAIKIFDTKTITEKIIPIHFADQDNDFGGFFYFSDQEFTGGLDNTEDIKNYLNDYTLSVNTPNSEYICSQQVEGFYYNAERGERLWPLNRSFRSEYMTGLTTTGGIYFSCYNSGYVNELIDCKTNAPGDETEVCVEDVYNKYKGDNGGGYGYYGSIEQLYSGQYMNVVAGVNYKHPGYFIEITGDSKLSLTFIRLINKYPLGLIYDYNGGVGLVGCRIDKEPKTSKSPNYLREIVNKAQLSGLESMFKYDNGQIIYTGTDIPEINVTCTGSSLEDTMLRLVVEGIMGLSNSLGADNAYKAFFNWSDEKMQGFSTQSVNNSTVLNYAKKKAEVLCRGKWGPEPRNKTEKIYCIEGPSTDPIEGDKYKNRTLIVKEGNVQITANNTVPSDDFYFDIFIGSGDLIIKEQNETNDIITGNVVFTKDGLISKGTTRNEFIEAISGSTSTSYMGEYAAIGSYIKGNFIVNGHVKSNDESGSGSLHNKYFVYGKFVTEDTINQLDATFLWRCRGGYTNEEPKNYCPLSHDDWKNPYQRASLVIIDQDFDSPLLK